MLAPAVLTKHSSEKHQRKYRRPPKGVPMQISAILSFYYLTYPYRRKSTPNKSLPTRKEVRNTQIQTSSSSRSPQQKSPPKRAYSRRYTSSSLPFGGGGGGGGGGGCGQCVPFLSSSRNCLSMILTITFKFDAIICRLWSIDANNSLVRSNIAPPKNIPQISKNPRSRMGSTSPKTEAFYNLVPIIEKFCQIVRTLSSNPSLKNPR